MDLFHITIASGVVIFMITSCRIFCCVQDCYNRKKITKKKQSCSSDGCKGEHAYVVL